MLVSVETQRLKGILNRTLAVVPDSLTFMPSNTFHSDCKRQSRYLGDLHSRFRIAEMAIYSMRPHISAYLGAGPMRRSYCSDESRQNLPRCQVRALLANENPIQQGKSLESG
jgi:hypothetical protein